MLKNIYSKMSSFQIDFFCPCRRSNGAWWTTECLPTAGWRTGSKREGLTCAEGCPKVLATQPFKGTWCLKDGELQVQVGIIFIYLYKHFFLSSSFFFLFLSFSSASSSVVDLKPKHIVRWTLPRLLTISLCMHREVILLILLLTYILTSWCNL